MVPDLDWKHFLERASLSDRSVAQATQLLTSTYAISDAKLPLHALSLVVVYTVQAMTQVENVE